MIKSNSKKAKENLKNYIIKIYDNEVDYSNHNITTDTTDYNIIKENIKTIFNLEVGNWYSKQVGEYNAFVNWCQGLPSIIDTCYYYNRYAKDDLAIILEETEEEKNKFTEEQAQEKLTHLLYREIFR